MSHLSYTEVLRSVDMFYVSLYGADIYEKWKMLKQEMNFATERHFVRWMLEFIERYSVKRQQQQQQQTPVGYLIGDVQPAAGIIQAPPTPAAYQQVNAGSTVTVPVQTEQVVQTDTGETYEQRQAHAVTTPTAAAPVAPTPAKSTRSATATMVKNEEYNSDRQRRLANDDGDGEENDEMEYNNDEVQPLATQMSTPLTSHPEHLHGVVPNQPQPQPDKETKKKKKHKKRKSKKRKRTESSNGESESSDNEETSEQQQLQPQSQSEQTTPQQQHVALSTPVNAQVISNVPAPTHLPSSAPAITAVTSNMSAANPVLDENGVEMIQQTPTPLAPPLEGVSADDLPIPDDLKTPFYQLPTADKPYPCNTCSASFANRQQLAQHENTVHISGQIYKCKYCAEVFYSKSDRLSHVIDEHNDVVKCHSCELCGQKFTTRSVMLAHQRAVHTQRELMCSFCDKSFNWPQALTLHKKRVHLGMCFKCEVCDKKLSSKQALLNHMQKLHRETDAAENMLQGGDGGEGGGVGENKMDSNMSAGGIGPPPPPHIGVQMGSVVTGDEGHGLPPVGPPPLALIQQVGNVNSIPPPQQQQQADMINQPAAIDTMHMSSLEAIEASNLQLSNLENLHVTQMAD